MPHSPKSGPIGIAELLDRLSLEIRRTLLKADPAQVHRLRVAIRRFRQALAMMEQRTAVENIHRRLRKIMALAGDVRDCDITAKLIGAKLIGKGNAPGNLHLRRENARRLLQPALARWLERKTEAKWRKTVIALGNPAPPGPVLLNGAKRLFKRARKAGESMRALHRVRIAAKKLRYTMEVAGYPDHGRLKSIKKLQEHLGNVQDYEAALRIVAEEGGSKKMQAQLKKEQRGEIQVFEQHWEQDFKDREKDWIKTLTEAR